jgi:hypothetical protein
MNSLLIHGIYDPETLKFLKDSGIKELSFDLRAKSSNLVPFRDLQTLLKMITSEKVFLTFEDDKKETILSFLNLLQSEPLKFYLIYRDSRPASFYKDVGEPFYWMFTPDSNWKEILTLKNCRGVLLPMKFQNEYIKMPELWALIESGNMDVYLHAESFEETQFLTAVQDIKLSIDLTNEVEKKYRTVDQEKLKKMKIWRKLNENSAGQ